jgi:putative FmdB family regulatory protein
MPTYEYKCKDCDEGFEVVQAFTDDALTECPTCDGALKKVFGSIGIAFKGSGFYKNDARPGSKSSKSASDSSTSTESGASSTDTSSSSSSDTKTESKPAAKTESTKKSEKSTA